MAGFAFSEKSVIDQVGNSQSGVAGALTPMGQAHVSFRLHAVIDGDATAARGYPVFREAVYFSRRDVIKGREDGVDRLATEDDFREHPEAYQRFKAWIANPQVSVRQLPYLSPAVLRLLDEGEITTVQELASAPNLVFRDVEGQIKQRVAIDAVPELIEPRALAREWLGKKPAGTSLAVPETETEQLRRQLADLQASLSRKPGRPKGAKNRPKANVQEPETNP